MYTVDTVDNGNTVNPIIDSNFIYTTDFPVMDKNKLDATVNNLIDRVSKSINVDCTVKPRLSVNGGTKQLKLKNRTKGMHHHGIKSRVQLLKRSKI